MDVFTAHVGLEQALEGADLCAIKIVFLRCTAEVQTSPSEVYLQPLLYEPGELFFCIGDALCLLLDAGLVVSATSPGSRYFSMNFPKGLRLNRVTFSSSRALSIRRFGRR
jgi:hypothetical protein